MSSTATHQMDASAAPRQMVAWRKCGINSVVSATAVIGALVLGSALGTYRGHLLSFPAVLVVAACLLGAAKLSAYGHSVSLCLIPIIAGGYLYGPEGGAVTGFAAAVGIALRERRLSEKTVFNAGAFAVAGFVGGALAGSFAWRSGATVPSSIVFGVVCPVAIYAVNSSLLALVLSLSEGTNPFVLWRERSLWMLPQVLILGQAATGAAIAYRNDGVYEVLAFALPVVAAYVAWRQYLANATRSLEDLREKNTDLMQLAARLQTANETVTQTYRGTLEALVGALDARDNEVQGHSYRVSAYSQLLAEELGIVRGSADWEAILRGALLHDVGKIGVQDAVLQKPGALTDLEWVEMRRHAEIGFGILKDVEFLRPAAALVRAHHEKFDGTGYPRGLKGEEIPLGARIFAVADTFDAITTDRPYRKAAPPEAAVAEIRRCAGTQFDPQVVAVFEVNWPRLWAIRANAMTMVA